MNNNKNIYLYDECDAVLLVICFGVLCISMKEKVYYEVAFE